MKVCTKCGVDKEDEKYRTGHNTCKDCFKKYHQKYRKENKEYLSNKRKVYYESRKEEELNRNKQYRNKNREKVTAIVKEYYINNIEQSRQSQREHDKKKSRYLLNSYVKKTLLLQGFPPESIDQQLIEVKRLLIKNKRKWLTKK